MFRPQRRRARRNWQAKAILHLDKSSFSGSFRGLGGIFRVLSTIQGVLFDYSADSVFREESLLTGVVPPIFFPKILILYWRNDINQGHEITKMVKWTIFVSNRVRFWRLRRHTSTQVSVEHPPSSLLGSQARVIYRASSRVPAGRGKSEMWVVWGPGEYEKRFGMEKVTGVPVISLSGTGDQKGTPQWEFFFFM